LATLGKRLPRDCRQGYGQQECVEDDVVAGGAADQVDLGQLVRG
jgi:hypothetical protein